MSKRQKTSPTATRVVKTEPVVVVPKKEQEDDDCSEQGSRVYVVVQPCSRDGKVTMRVFQEKDLDHKTIEAGLLALDHRSRDDQPTRDAKIKRMHQAIRTAWHTGFSYDRIYPPHRLDRLVAVYNVPASPL